MRNSDYRSQQDPILGLTKAKQQVGHLTIGVVLQAHKVAAITMIMVMMER